MSRAFVKEGTGELDPLPDLPISPHTNYVTPRGLAALQSRLAATQSELARLRARPDRLDKLPEAAAERDIRYLEARLRSAIPIDPPAAPQEVAFATRVTVADDTGAETSYEIVGEDEADPAQGRIAPHAPLARSLLGSRIGDTVVWTRPTGRIELEVLAIAPVQAMILRPLAAESDRALVAALFAEAADYVAIERDAAPGPELTDEYFSDAPPGVDPATSFRLGALDADGTLLGLIEQSFGYPTAEDSYLGLMLLAPRARGQLLGRGLLEEAEAEARRRGKRRLYLAVLDANPRGRAFWEREGFVLHEGGRSVTLGEKTQTATRMVKEL